MSDIFSSLLGGIGSAIGGAAQPAPTTSSKGLDYNPVTNINAVGAPDLTQVNQILETLNAGNEANGGLIFKQPTAAPTFTAGLGSNPLLILALVGVGVILLWKFAR